MTERPRLPEACPPRSFRNSPRNTFAVGSQSSPISFSEVASASRFSRSTMLGQMDVRSVARMLSPDARDESPARPGCVRGVAGKCVSQHPFLQYDADRQ